LRRQYSARALPAATAIAQRTASTTVARGRRGKPRRQEGVGYWVVVNFDMNIIDFLVTLNVTVGRMIIWRNTASQIGHTVTNKTGMAVTVVVHFSHTEIIQ
jgi:hypothetical protein